MSISDVYTFDTLPVRPQPKPLESLTSYLTRLAAANKLRSVPDLFKLSFPIGRPKLTSQTGDFPPPSFGNLPTIACRSEPELLSTTFYHLGKKFDRLLQPQPLALFLSESIARHLRYCPKCLAEHGYYSLVWRFLAVKGCPEHGCRLLDHCEHCGQAIPLLGISPKLGICPICGGDLRNCQVELFDESQQRMVQSHYRDFAYLLSPQPYETSGERITGMIGRRFAAWRRIRQLKISDIAQALNLSPTILYYIENGPEHRGIKLQWYVEYADFLHINLQDIFEITPPDQLVLSNDEKLIRKIRQVVATLEQSDKPVTQQAVGEVIGVKIGIFSKYPRVKALWAEYKAKWRREREDELIAKVQQTIDCLRQQGKPVGRGIVCRMMGTSYTGLIRYVAAWTILEEQSDFPPRKISQPPKANQEHQHKGKSINRIQPAIEDLKQTGKPASRQLGKTVNMVRTGLSDSSRVKKARGRHRLPQDEDELIDKIRQGIVCLEKRGILVTTEAISGIVGLSSGTLRHYPRVKAVLFEEVIAKSHLHRARQFQRREAELVCKVQQAIDTLATNEKRMTQKAVCEMVSMSSVSLKKYPRVKLLLEQHGLTRPCR